MDNFNNNEIQHAPVTGQPINYPMNFDPLVAALIYSIIKILLDFFRDTHPARLITTNQIMCAVIAIALGISIVLRKTNREKIVID